MVGSNQTTYCYITYSSYSDVIYRDDLNGT